MFALNVQERAEEVAEVADASSSLGGPATSLDHDKVPVPVAPGTEMTVTRNEERLKKHAMEVSLQPTRPSTGGEVSRVSVPLCTAPFLQGP